MSQTKKIIGIIIILFILGLDFFVPYSLFKEKEHIENKLSLQAQNEIEILEQYIEGTIRRIDITLQNIATEIPHNHETIDEIIKQHFPHLPEADSIRYANKLGDVFEGIGVDKKHPINIADRDYFFEAFSKKEVSLIASKPVLGKISKKWVIILSRKVLDKKQVPQGLIYAAVTIDSFQHIFSNLNLGSKGILYLHNQSFDILLNFFEKVNPFPEVVPFKNNELYHLVEQGNIKGTAVLSSPSGENPRRFAFKKVNGYPFYVSVGLSIEEALKDWQREVYKELALLLVLNLLCLGVILHAKKPLFE